MTAALTNVFAAKGVKGIEADFYERLNVYFTTAIALLTIFLLVWLIQRLRSWFFDSDDSDAPVSEMLTQFRQLKRQGELSDEEYRLITHRLSGKTTLITSAPKSEPASPSATTSEAAESTDPPEE